MNIGEYFSTKNIEYSSNKNPPIKVLIPLKFLFFMFTLVKKKYLLSSKYHSSPI